MNFPVLNKDGIQLAVYPTMVVNISQIPNGGYSHRGRLAVDEAGSDTGKDDFFAPFDAEIEYVELVKNKTGVQITNTVKVECADGTIAEPYELHEYTYHDDDISDCYVGRKLNQGEVYYQEGTAGKATGNHVHFGVGRGHYEEGEYPLTLNSNGNYETKNEVDPTDVFFITTEHKVKRTRGMKWSKIPVQKVIEAKSLELRIGAKVKFIDPKENYTYHTTRQKIPYWVKSMTHIVGRISGDKVLLVKSVDSKTKVITDRGVFSWIYTKDLEVIE